MDWSRRTVFSLVYAFLGLAAGIQSFAANFTNGDVFVGIGNGCNGKGEVQWRHQNGALVQILDPALAGETMGMAFDGVGRLYATCFSASNIVVFNPDGIRAGTFGSGLSGHPESLVADGAGNFYLGATDGDNDVRKFAPGGALLTNFNVAVDGRGSDWLDLASDQCTLYYTSEGDRILRYNVCAGVQLPDFVSHASGLLSGQGAYGLRVLPGSGQVLVADSVNIKRLSTDGTTVLMTYDATGEDDWFAMNFDPDGASFWTAGYKSFNVCKFDIASGTLLFSFNARSAATNESLTGLCVFGERLASLPSPYGLKSNALVQLQTLRQVAAQQQNCTVLTNWDAATNNLGQSLHTNFWDPPSRVLCSCGSTVFDLEAAVVVEINRIIQASNSGVSNATLQDIINRIVEADRLLAVTKIRDALLAGISPALLAPALTAVTNGDQAAIGAPIATEIIFAENFDALLPPSLPSGWTTTATGAEKPWITTNDISDTAPNAAFSIDATNIGVNALVSPSIPLSAGQPRLQFRNRYGLEHGSGINGYDGGVLELKIGGAVFKDVITAGGSWVSNGYDSVLDNRWGNPLGGRAAWSGTNGGFVTTVVNLPASAASQTVQLRWRCGSDDGNGGSGWRIDTVNLICSRTAIQYYQSAWALTCSLLPN